MLIDIGKLTYRQKCDLLARLYNTAVRTLDRALGHGLTTQMASDFVAKQNGGSWQITKVCDVPIPVNLTGDEFDPRQFDALYGDGKGLATLRSVLQSA